VDIPLGPPPGNIVFHHEDDTVLLTSDGSLQALYSPGTLGPPVFAAISPNCSLLALTIPNATQSGYQADIHIFSPKSALEYDFQATARYEDQPTWSPDSNAIAYRLDAAAVQVADLAGSPPTQLLESSRGVFSLAWSPGGNWIALTEGPSTSRTLQLVSPVSKEIRVIPTGEAIPSPSAIAWSPDGAKIAFSGEDCHLYVAELQASVVRSVVTTFGCIEDVAWSPDGSSIVFSSTRGTDEQTRFLHDLYSVGIDGSNLQRLTVSGKDRAPQTCRGA
jgi:Tol biopolymer transport system component